MPASSPTTQPPDEGLPSLDEPFLPSLPSKNFKYVDDPHHACMTILMKSQVLTDATVVEKAAICTCLAIVDIGFKLTVQWRRIILRKVHKSTWEVFD